ncbi:XdhC family protein [Parendozoicomonas haliclonae]|uniref:Putative xanthine dehydrogenase subunit A n=1 Tax=Parendozoicomonas haliclonae TaxID=1960125 RepID=A0A1X7AG18_9GAMM|nr:XdhC family protein [Parendozoicomonas haliclonae]SMA39165.1 putative xanthine dehydrogenase subunit A [Parendozoicomonas haliclonae]
MHSSNVRVIDQIHQWLSAGHPVWLATVLETWGSSPRPEGSLLAYVPGLGTVGSLSGGCIEEDLLTKLASEDNIPTPSIHGYGQTDSQNARLALPCGGQLRILLERLEPEQAGLFLELFTALEQGQCVSRTVHLRSGDLGLAALAGLAKPNKPGLYEQPDTITHTLGPAFQLLLTGAGETTRCVAELARAVDFSVTVCDFREEFLEGWNMPGVELVKTFPDDLIRERFNTPTSAIIALAHDPRLDDMALLEALTSKAFYIAAMGSQRTSARRRERLQELGLTAEQLERLYAPAGIPTGSKTPWEIAISIVAQLIAVRNKLFSD